MTTLTTRRTCPYCGTSLQLASLPVVAVNTTYRKGEGNEDDDRHDDHRHKYPMSGAKTEDWIGPHPVLAKPERDPGRKPERKVPRWLADKAQWLADEALNKRLTPLNEVGVPIDMPARLCTQCQTPLPADIDERDPLIIAVVGTSGSGKTHLLASMLHQAAQNHGFQGIQCQEFAPDETTAELFDKKYYRPVFINRENLDETAAKEAGKRQLVYRVAFDGKEPYLLMFYDIAGETLTEHRSRVEHADYLSRASGVICLVDPVCLNAPPGYDWRPARHHDEVERWNQANLLNACINLLPPDLQEEIPFAIALSKADLISEYLTWQPGVDQDPEVRALLKACNAHDVISATNRLGADRVSFHALAAIGADPGENGELKVIEPFRCLDPLLAVLRGIPDATADA